MTTGRLVTADEMRRKVHGDTVAERHGDSLAVRAFYRGRHAAHAELLRTIPHDHAEPVCECGRVVVHGG